MSHLQGFLLRRKNGRLSTGVLPVRPGVPLGVGYNFEAPQRATFFQLIREKMLRDRPQFRVGIGGKVDPRTGARIFF